jgi:K+-transporting ATPase ATPase A chain
MQFCIVLICVIFIAPILGKHIFHVMQRKQTFLDRFLSPIASLIYKKIGVNPDQDQDWKTYFIALLSLNFVGIVFLILLQRAQAYLPYNPQQLQAVSWLQSFNTAISFTTNTNWQSYMPESTLSPFVQMIGLTVQNFLSALSGLAVAFVFMRSFKSHKEGTHKHHETLLGNFWVDCVRGLLWILLPLCLVLSLVYISLGTPQNFRGPVQATTIEKQQIVIPQGPIASQEAIKILGSNGGGYFNANSAHPYENPSFISNIIQMITMLIIAASLPFAFGHKISNKHQGRILFITMIFLLTMGVLIAAPSLTSHIYPMSLEGVETRFGKAGTLLYSLLTTASSCGATNGALASLPPLSAFALFFNMLIGGIGLGGVGSGFYNLILYVILAVFLAGLMVGRTPEYLGKKIESFEIKMVVIAILIPPLCILGLTALACSIFDAASLPHNYSEILYAFTSSTTNNGSSFASLQADHPFYQWTTAISMLAGRYGVMFACLAIAGSFSQKIKIPRSSGAFPTKGALFCGLLIAVIIITNGLIYFPALSLGSIAECLQS